MFLCVSDYQNHYIGTTNLRGHSERKEREQGCRPLVAKIFSKSVTALSSGQTISETYCCTSEHRTKGRPLQSTTLQRNLRLGHSQRRQGTGRRGQRLYQAVGPDLVTLTASTRKVKTPEYTQMILRKMRSVTQSSMTPTAPGMGLNSPSTEDARKDDRDCIILVS